MDRHSRMEGRGSNDDGVCERQRERGKGREITVERKYPQRGRREGQSQHLITVGFMTARVGLTIQIRRVSCSMSSVQAVQARAGNQKKGQPWAKGTQMKSARQWPRPTASRFGVTRRLREKRWFPRSRCTVSTSSVAFPINDRVRHFLEPLHTVPWPTSTRPLFVRGYVCQPSKRPSAGSRRCCSLGRLVSFKR